MNFLCFIPARGGSRGIPGKNIKQLNGKPLIYYAIETARELVPDEYICVSTDDENIMQKVEEYGLKIPFKRPVELAADTAGTYEVLLHGINYYEKAGYNFSTLVLLQPTSPFRSSGHIKEAMKLYSENLDMVVSVKESKANPYYNLFEENEYGFLQLSKKSCFVRRQDAPDCYEYNGAIYIININSLKKFPLSQFKKVKKYLMDDVHSLDLDTPLDWALAEFIIEKEGFNYLKPNA